MLISEHFWYRNNRSRCWMLDIADIKIDVDAHLCQLDHLMWTILQSSATYNASVLLRIFICIKSVEYPDRWLCCGIAEEPPTLHCEWQRRVISLISIFVHICLCLRWQQAKNRSRKVIQSQAKKVSAILNCIYGGRGAQAGSNPSQGKRLAVEWASIQLFAYLRPEMKISWHSPLYYGGGGINDQLPA